MQGKQDLHGSDCTGPRIPGSDCTLWNRLCSARLSIAFKVKSYHTEFAMPFVTTWSVYEAEYMLYCLLVCSVSRCDIPVCSGWHWESITSFSDTGLGSVQRVTSNGDHTTVQHMEKVTKRTVQGRRDGGRMWKINAGSALSLCSKISVLPGVAELSPRSEKGAGVQ